MNTKMPKIAMGAWSWGAGAAGGDQVFGNHLFENDLKPVFDKAMELGLNLWDTAAVYGEGTSERILGNFVKDVNREDVLLSTKFTPQIADGTSDAMQNMIDGSKERLHTDVIDIYWIHNPLEVCNLKYEKAHKIKQNTHFFNWRNSIVTPILHRKIRAFEPPI